MISRRAAPHGPTVRISLAPLHHLPGFLKQSRQRYDHSRMLLAVWRVGDRLAAVKPVGNVVAAHRPGTLVADPRITAARGELCSSALSPRLIAVQLHLSAVAAASAVQIAVGAVAA
jgi:hypothetical protein